MEAEMQSEVNLPFRRVQKVGEIYKIEEMSIQDNEEGIKHGAWKPLDTDYEFEDTAYEVLGHMYHAGSIAQF